jgi:hypothetical protein
MEEKTKTKAKKLAKGTLTIEFNSAMEKAVMAHLLSYNTYNPSAEIKIKD